MVRLNLATVFINQLLQLITFDMETIKLLLCRKTHLLFLKFVQENSSTLHKLHSCFM